ncbi:MAG: hypothetical protein JWO31_1398 [Phycisphaerales bacterium]|nr:hypothetical protein [Phycisphaerales bacterium]
MPRLRLAVVLLTVAGCCSVAAACLWDYDTIRDERRGLPGIAEVLAGRWERHSAFFYGDRVDRMRAVVAREPANGPARDNLAVALEKRGQVDAAIAVARETERVLPGRYETAANLGTFHIHKGELDEGIAWIKRALAINPAAHFNREAYQLRLAEFLRDGRADPRRAAGRNFLGFALREGLYAEAESFAKTEGGGSAAMMPAGANVAATGPSTHPSAAPADSPALTPDKIPHAGRGNPGRLEELGLEPDVFDGVVGMIRFGTGTSAELYLTLGDLLAASGDKHLAYRAYRRAIDLNHPRQAYLDAMTKALGEYVKNHADLSPEAVAAERSAADAWVAAYQAHEDGLIRAGGDPDAEAGLAGFYAANGPAVVPDPPTLADRLLPRDFHARQMTIWVGGFLCLAAALVAVRAGVRRKRRPRTRPTP